MKHLYDTHTSALGKLLSLTPVIVGVTYAVVAMADTFARVGGAL